MSRSVWVFGYGSLIWRPGFEYETSMIGHVKGFERVFYQGNDKHRGKPGQIGRVATLLENSKAETWGRAFLVTVGENSRNCPLAYLDTRESKQGGYATLTTTFYPRATHQPPLEVLVYVALPSNSLYLGPKPYPEMAREIVAGHGECGSNVEYVLNIADFMREEVFGIDDEHLFMLEMHILAELQHQIEDDQSFRARMESNHSDCSVMVPSGSCASVDASSSSTSTLSSSPKFTQEELLESEDAFASKLHARKLRCVDI